MIRYIIRKEIDCSQWDALVTRAPNSLIYALSWYLDIVTPGWSALIKEENGRYLAVMPLPLRSKFGFHYLQQPVFTQQLGMFSCEALSSADWQEIGKQLRNKFRLISHYSFNTSNAELLQADQLGIAGTRSATYHLNLQPTYKQLLSGYKPNRRWRLNQARRQALIIEPSTDIDLLVQLFTENTAGKISGIIGEAYEYRILRELYIAASQRGMTLMWQARTASEGVVAMILLFVFDKQFTYIFSSTTSAGKKAGAITVLLDEVFHAYAGQNICFDFEVMNVANLVHFYSSFGSVAAPFLSISLNRLPWPVKQLKAARMAVYKHFHRGNA